MTALTDTVTADQVEPALLTRDGVAALLSVAPSTVDRMNRSGRLPMPVRLGRGCVRWRRAELEAWIEAGCPPRVVWQRRKEETRA